MPTGPATGADRACGARLKYRPARVAGSLAVLAALAVGSVHGARQWEAQARARQELALQATEIAACRGRLRRIHQAWARYRAHHGGLEPPTVQALVPRHLADPKQLNCPTAERARRLGRVVEQGSFRVGRRQYCETYGLHWLGSGHPRARKRCGDRAPLVTCTVHRESLFWAAYQRSPRLGEFSAAKRGSWIPEVAQADTLAVRRNGEVGALAPEEE